MIFDRFHKLSFELTICDFPVLKRLKSKGCSRSLEFKITSEMQPRKPGIDDSADPPNENIL